jgi:hypothetical protein
MRAARTAAKLSLTALGTYNGVMKRVRDAAAEGAMQAARDMEADGVRRLRADTIKGFSDGLRLSKTWRGQVYPIGSKKSSSPSVVLWSKAPTLAQAFNEPATLVNTSGGRFLAIPTENAPAPLARKTTGKPRSALLAAQRDPRINLQFVPLHGGRKGLLVHRARRGGKMVQVVMFVLVPRATLKKRMNYSSLFRDFEREWPRRYRVGIVTALKRAGF